jgi:hypothetical protein
MAESVGDEFTIVEVTADDRAPKSSKTNQATIVVLGLDDGREALMMASFLRRIRR